METKAEVRPAFREHLVEPSFYLKFDFDQPLYSCVVTVDRKVLNSLQTTGKQQVSNRKIFICATSAALPLRTLIWGAEHYNCITVKSES